MNSFKIVASSAIKCPLNKFLDLFNHQNELFKIQYIKIKWLIAVRVNLPLIKMWKIFLSMHVWQIFLRYSFVIMTSEYFVTVIASLIGEEKIYF